MESSVFNLKEFGFILRAAREKSGLLQQAAADQIGIGIRTLRGIESGATEIGVGDLFKAAELYKTTVGKLLNLEDQKIVNSFNHLQEQAKSIVYGSNNNITVDREWMEETNKRFAFLEKMIEKLQEEKR